MTDYAQALTFSIGAIIAIIVISNPISTSAIFIALTEKMSRKQKQATIKKSLTYSAGILILFAVSGLLIFKVFGFTIGAFRIAGGVLLFTTAVGMLNPKTSQEEASDVPDNIALIPLSIPFTAGPGTIVTVVVLMSEAETKLNIDLVTGILCALGIFIGIATCLGVTYVMLANSEFIDGVLKEGGRRVVTTLMGLIVMAIAIQFFINGIKDILPEFLAIASGM
ncbi:multiple antibiotic resistance protein [Candidatus Methanophagaceae archaeon]|nr:multiple antibiotic resistance protein [Methanophagales archaeon]